jgi:hypothetical protein
MARQYFLARGRSNRCDLFARGWPNPRGPFDASSRATATAALLGLALLAAPLACGSDSDDGADDDATEQNDPPSESEAPPRDTRPATPAPSVEDDDEDDAMPANPAAADPDDAPDEPPAAPGASAGNSGSLPPAAANSFASCTRRDGSYGTNCDYLYVTMAAAERCVQLSIDNCGDGYTAQGLPIDTPLSWKVSSATIGSAPDECSLGVFNPESIVVVDASGSIEWPPGLPTALPTGIVLDVTLQPSSTADDTSSIDVVTTEPLSPGPCEE